MRRILFAAILSAPAAGLAQPYSESMMDCASLYYHIGQVMSDNTEAYQATYVANQWQMAAVEQVKSEGRSQTSEEIWDQIIEKTKVWEGKGIGMFFAMTEDFRDWSKYCLSFAKHTGVSYQP